jgi:hypothetical protein
VYSGTHRYTSDKSMERVISQLDPALLCRLAQRLRFDYQCLPMYSIHRWCPAGMRGMGDGDGVPPVQRSRRPEGGETGAFSIS